MEVTYERCCGLDVHKETVVACVFVPGAGKQPHKEIRTFNTMTADLLALADWLTAQGVTHVAIESTGVYWKGPWNLLESSFTLLLVNAQHIKQVPGRKTDVRDCEWIADLLRHGLLKASFVPDLPQRELRELTRYRTTLIRERSAERNRIQKTLEGAGIKLASVASDVLGSSGRGMLEALVEGTIDAATLADLAKGRLRTKLPQLERALTGASWSAPALPPRPPACPPRRLGGTDRSTQSGDRRAAAPFSGQDRAAGRDLGRRSAHGRSISGRDRN